MHDAIVANVPRPLSVVIGESVEAVSASHPEHALRILARILVRSHHRLGDPAPKVGDAATPSSLTVAPHPSPDHGDEAA